MDQVEGLIRIVGKAKNLHLEAFRCGGIRTGSEFSAFLFHLYVSTLANQAANRSSQ